MSINPVGGVNAQPKPIQTDNQNQAQAVQAPAEVTPGTKVDFEPVDTAEGTKAISDEAVEKNLENLNKLLEAKKTNVTMEYDNLSSPKVVNILDAESGNVIKQMPPSSVVEIAMKARDYVIGLMVDKTV